MPKRKRGEASLEENIAKWKKELVRGLKTAKGFERQRLSKRIREADPEKTARLEKEVLVLKVSSGQDRILVSSYDWRKLSRL